MKLRVAIILVLIVSSLQAEVIDRIVAVVNKHIITLSDVRREREIRMMLGDKIPPDDASLIKELVDAQLIEEQIAQFPGVDITDAQVEEEARKVSDRHGLSPNILHDGIRRRLRTAEFFELRFRQFLHATDEEIQRYYETEFVPEAQKRAVPDIPPLAQVTEQIRSNLIEEKLAREVDTWLEALRRRSDLEIFH